MNSRPSEWKVLSKTLLPKQVKMVIFPSLEKGGSLKNDWKLSFSVHPPPEVGMGPKALQGPQDLAPTEAPHSGLMWGYAPPPSFGKNTSNRKRVQSCEKLKTYSLKLAKIVIFTKPLKGLQKLKMTGKSPQKIRWYFPFLRCASNIKIWGVEISRLNINWANLVRAELVSLAIARKQQVWVWATS